MAARFVFCTVAHEGDRATLGEHLKEPQGEFLTVVLDRAISMVDAAALEQLGPVAAREIGPGESAGLDLAQQCLAWPEIGHPDVIKVFGQTAPPQPRGKDTQAVFRFFGGMDRFGAQHGK